LTIRDVIAATPRARLVQLDLNTQSFDYAAGQAVAVGIPGSERKRPYSIAGAPEDARRTGCIELLVGVDADGQAGPHLLLSRGAPVEVDGPLGTFAFPSGPAEHHFVFVAGGTGIAPLRAMLRHAIATPDPARHVGLLYSARTPDDFAFEDEFRALASAGTINFRQTITRDTKRDWSGLRGRIDRQALSEVVYDTETLCFVCGPMAMVDEVPKLLMEIGISRERIKIEEW
jgi:NAD(P)H-flavin reductase